MRFGDLSPNCCPPLWAYYPRAIFSKKTLRVIQADVKRSGLTHEHIAAKLGMGVGAFRKFLYFEDVGIARGEYSIFCKMIQVQEAKYYVIEWRYPKQEDELL